MNIKFLGILFLMLFITSFSFAAAPVLSEIDWTPKAQTDLNYSKWNNSDFISFWSTVTGEDLNAEDCYYTIDNGDTWLLSSIDMNTDTNIIMVSLNIPSVINDLNFGLKCVNTADEESDPVYQRIWDDSNAPSVAGVVTGGIYSKTLTITGNDVATNTGNGSGVKTIYYRLNSGAWQSSTSNPLTINKTSTGSYTIDYYALDNLDNNGYSFLTSNTFTVQQAADADCATISWASLLMSVLILFIVINRFLAMTGTNPDVNLMVSIALAAIIGALIILTFVGGVCV